MNAGASFFQCAEYGAADVAQFQSICGDGGGTWSAGGCPEANVVGVCLPLNYCNGMGIGFHDDAATVADAKESCSSTGGTWEEPEG